MTDKEQFEALMGKFGVPIALSDPDIALNALVIEAKSSPKVLGYAGFCAVFKFDPVTGAFTSVGIWE